MSVTRIAGKRKHRERRNNRQDAIRRQFWRGWHPKPLCPCPVMPRRKKQRKKVDPCLFTKTEIAQKLNVSKMTIHRWTSSKTIPAYRKGRVVRYDIAECLTALGQFKIKEVRRK